MTIAGGAGSGTITINAGGLFTLNSGGNITDLILAGTNASSILLTGGGALSMSNNFNNRIFSTTGDYADKRPSNTIQGSGQIGINNGGYAFTLTNKGTINANQTNALSDRPEQHRDQHRHDRGHRQRHAHLDGPFTNTGGTIQATGASSVVAQRQHDHRRHAHDYQRRQPSRTAARPRSTA